MRPRDHDHAAQLLDKVRKKISDPAHWTQMSYALNEHGEEVSELNPKACRWCAMGALNAVSPWTNASPMTRLLVEESLVRAAGASPTDHQSQAARMYIMLRFNDTHPHAEVLSWMDRALGALQRPP